MSRIDFKVVKTGIKKVDVPDDQKGVNAVRLRGCQHSRQKG
jgi:hypothetical protein